MRFFRKRLEIKVFFAAKSGRIAGIPPVFSLLWGNCGGAASERMRSLHDAKASSSAKRVGVRDFRVLPDVVSGHAPLMPEFA